MNRKDSLFLASFRPCASAQNWLKTVRPKSLHEAWNMCERSDWMLWALCRIGFKDDRKYRLYACACVRGTPLADGRTLWDLLTDQRSRHAVEVAERYAEGKASEEERCEARKAAYAYADYAAATDPDAADAAAAARANAHRWQANLLRHWISWDEVAAAIETYKEAKDAQS